MTDEPDQDRLEAARKLFAGPVAFLLEDARYHGVLRACFERIARGLK